MIDEKNSALRIGGFTTKGKMGINHNSYSSSKTITMETGPKISMQNVHQGENSRVGSIIDKLNGTFKSKGRGFKRLSNTELQDKIRKVLCFRCDQKYSPHHICKNKQF